MRREIAPHGTRAVAAARPVARATAYVQAADRAAGPNIGPVQARSLGLAAAFGAHFWHEPPSMAVLHIVYRLLGLVLIVLALALVWGVVIEPRMIDEQYEPARIPGLPAAWDAKTFAVVADPQLGMWLDNRGTVERIVETIVQRHPAFVLVAGDFIYHPTEDDSVTEALEEFDDDEKSEVRTVIEAAVRTFAPLPKANVPTYAVLGNHDYAMSKPDALELDWIADELSRALQQAGIQVLRNAAVKLEAPGAANASLYLGGHRRTLSWRRSRRARAGTGAACRAAHRIHA